MRLAVLFSLMAFAMIGCGPSRYMAQVTTPPVQPLAGKALVIFHRPEIISANDENEIRDGEQFIGILVGNQAVAYNCDPGEHVFTSHSYNWSVIRANLTGGKVYDVFCSSSENRGKLQVGNHVYDCVFGGTVVVLEPVSKNDKRRTDVQGWLASEQFFTARTDVENILDANGKKALNQAVAECTTGTHASELRSLAPDDNR